MIDLNNFINENNIGYAHKFNDKMILTAEMLETLEKSKVEGKFMATVKINNKEEIIDYLTGKDLLALRDGKHIECTWTRSKSGKAYWNHSSNYIEDEGE